MMANNRQNKISKNNITELMENKSFLTFFSKRNYRHCHIENNCHFLHGDIQIELFCIILRLDLHIAHYIFI